MNGSQPPAREYIYPLSTRLKMRAAHLGKKFTRAHRLAISKAVRIALAKKKKAARRG